MEERGPLACLNPFAVIEWIRCLNFFSGILCFLVNFPVFPNISRTMVKTYLRYAHLFTSRSLYIRTDELNNVYSLLLQYEKLRFPCERILGSKLYYLILCFFCFFGPLVIFLVIRFSIYSALWIRFTVPA